MNSRKEHTAVKLDTEILRLSNGRLKSLRILWCSDCMVPVGLSYRLQFVQRNSILILIQSVKIIIYIYKKTG